MSAGNLIRNALGASQAASLAAFAPGLVALRPAAKAEMSRTDKPVHRCRFCAAGLSETFVDLGMSPLSNSFIPPEHADTMEKFYPLHAYVCSDCRLVQLRQFETPDHIFSDYLYFSSYSDTWLRHAAAYARAMTERLHLGPHSSVIEVASNDGYLLQYFHADGIPVLGIEPAENVARVARGKGIRTMSQFLGRATAAAIARDRRADLLVANNVLAHVPDINDFTAGLATLLAPEGVLTVEFPHLLRLIEQTQFDTIYHEHFSYLSLLAVERIFAHHGLVVFDVDELPTHGGSLRVYARRGKARAVPTERLAKLRADEAQAGLDGPDAYRDFAERVSSLRCDIVEFFVHARRTGKSVAGYGAPAKGNTLLNACGIRPDLLGFTVDRSPHKQGMFLPGTHIPIYDPNAIMAARPDYLFILPWNLRDEVMQQMAGIRDWGGKFVVPIPRIEIIP